LLRQDIDPCFGAFADKRFGVEAKAVDDAGDIALGQGLQSRGSDVFFAYDPPQCVQEIVWKYAGST
jgi:hypothetical protein